MRTFITKALFLFIFIFLSFQASITQIHVPSLKLPGEETQLQPNHTQQVIQSMNALPLYFIENKGQVDEKVQYQVKLSGMNVYFTSEEIVYQLFQGEEEKVRVKNIRMKFRGMNEEVEVEGAEESEGKVNYFIGNDPERWVQGAKTYEKVIYRELYPDIDLIVYGGGGKIKHEYRVRVGGEAEKIEVRYRGIERVRINKRGQIEIETSEGVLREDVPFSYQVINGQWVEVESEYVISSDNTVRLKVGKYRKDRELIIDPALMYSTYLGGYYADEGNGIAVDGSGNVYVVGTTPSSDFPCTSSAYDTSYNGGTWDAFVTKLNSTGTNLIYSTFLGGSGDDYGQGIKVDGSGNAYVTGGTWSSNFPFTRGVYDPTHNGDNDAFITKINSSGTNLVYSTFLGGSNHDDGKGIALCEWEIGSAYITGDTDSTDFPTAGTGPWDISHNGGTDVFIAKINSSGTDLIYSTYLGGSNNDLAHGIAYSGIYAPYAYVTGETWSSDFPTHPNSYDPSYNGAGDAFMTIMSSGGAAPIYSTFLGGSGYDFSLGIAVDGNGDAYVTGGTSSSNFPTTRGAYDTTHHGNRDAFITKINCDGSNLFYSTYLGGISWEQAYGIAVDGIGNAYITGGTDSYDFPTTSGAYDTTLNGDYDVFITELNSIGKSLLYSTYLGGGQPFSTYSANDNGYAIAIDGIGNVYVTGEASSIDFPTTRSAYDTTHNGFSDAFITKLNIHIKDDVLGSWPSGVWYRNSITESWFIMSTTPAEMVAAGDIDGDGADDLIGVWGSGLWVKYSSSGIWAKLSTSLPWDIASGDMNGDGRDDILGSWASGVWYRNTNTGSWIIMSTTPAEIVAAGDIDGDGTDDLIGVWISGLWFKGSAKNQWYLITSVLPTDIGSGDMNGDGRDDILGSWPSGVWYRSSIGGGWVKMSTPANLVAAGDIDGDGTDDLIGTWSSGLWVKNSATATWQFICTSLPSDIDAGLFRTGWGAGAVSYDSPVAGVNAEGPGYIGSYEDLSSESPGGRNFVYLEEENRTPREKRLDIMRVPGPGEPGFKYTEQKNLVPGEKIKGKNKRRK